MKIGVKRGSNVNEIAFIICTNDDSYLESCLFFVERLQVPKGMSISVHAIRGAKSMTSGYNQGIQETNARYKVYLHQDVFILNQDFITDIMTCFQENPKLGMLGVCGTSVLPQNAEVWESLDTGGCYSIGTFAEYGNIAVKPQLRSFMKPYEPVEYIDGMLMVTSYDLEWDERVEGFHFYDVSQSLRFREAGLQLGIVDQREGWIFHDFGPLNLATYQKNRKRFCELYPVFTYTELKGQEESSIYQMLAMIKSQLISFFQKGKRNEIRSLLDEIGNAIYYDQDLLLLYWVMEIRQLEETLGIDLFVGSISDYHEIRKKYHRLKMELIQFHFGYQESKEIARMIIRNEYSIPAVIVVSLRSIPMEDQEQLMEVGKELEKQNFLSMEEWKNMRKWVELYEKEQVPSAEDL